jgi:elongation factor Tu
VLLARQLGVRHLVVALSAPAGEPRWVASVGALLDAVDAYLPVPDRHVSAPFLGLLD